MSYTVHMIRTPSGWDLVFYDKYGELMIAKHCHTSEAIALTLDWFESGFFKDELGNDYLERIK